MSSSQHFELDRSARGRFLLVPWLMSACALLFASLALLPDNGRPGQALFTVGLAVVGFFGFGVGALYSWRIVRHLPEASISVDGDGLWPTIKGKDLAMVPWSSIARLRERRFLQRLEVLDFSGSVVASLEYQLEDFERLRGIVLERARLVVPVIPAFGVYRKSRWYHFFHLSAIFGFSLFGVSVGRTNPLIGYVGMAFVVSMIARDYWRNPFQAAR